MPPKKKSRVPVKSTFDTCRAGNPQAAADAPLPKTPAKSKIIDRLASNEPVLSDAWTDEQETTLFKAISVYRWKPAGMHKHFRMLSITNLMANHGVMDTHTRPPGIWKKLGALYDMKLMDEREDMDDDVFEGREPKWKEFVLPREFNEMMAMRLESNSKNLVSLREAGQGRGAKSGLDNDQEGGCVEENVGGDGRSVDNRRKVDGGSKEDDGRREDGGSKVGDGGEGNDESKEDDGRKEGDGRKGGDGRKESEEEKEPGESGGVEESEEAGAEVENSTTGDEEEIVQRTQNLEVTESIAPTPGRRGNRLNGVASPPRLPRTGNFAPPIKGRGGTPRRRARARGRGGFDGRWNATSTRGRRSDEATPARSENLIEVPNSSSQNAEDTGETTEEEDSNSGKGGDEEAEDLPLVPVTPKRGGGGGRGRGRGRRGSGASTAVVEPDSVRRSIRNK